MHRVFQFVYQKIQEKLKSYIIGGEIDEKISMQKFEMTLCNIKIKKSALKSLNIPFSVHNSSKVKKIVLSLSKPSKLKLQIENLHTVINPATLKFNQNSIHDKKFAKLKQWETTQRESMNTSGTYGKQFSNWILPQILSNFKVLFRNFTVLYQDTESIQISGYPCLCIFKFGSIKVWRTDSKFQKIKENLSKSVYLMVEVSEISLTLSCDPLDFEKGTNIDTFYDELRPSERNYVLRPCSFEMKIALGSAKSNLDMLINHIIVNFTDDIQLAINEYQRVFIDGIIRFVENSMASTKYAFLKPKTSVKSSPEDWWHYILKAAKHDLRFNMGRVLSNLRAKETYISYYIRTQQVIQAPVLPKLTPSEEQQMKEIEERFTYEEIIDFRTQALEDVRKKTSHEKSTYFKNPELKEELKGYFKEYYKSALEAQKDTTIRIKSKTLPENPEPSKDSSTFSFAAITEVELRVPRLIVSLQVLRKIEDFDINILDATGCRCGRCIKQYTEPAKKKLEVNEVKALNKFERETLIHRKNMHSGLRSGNAHSLLPSRKMRDIAIEYGQEIFDIGSVCWKSKAGEPYEHNILKESTFLIAVIDKIFVNGSGKKESISIEAEINSIFAFDPLVCRCPGFDFDYDDKPKSFEEFLSYPGWHSTIFKEVEKNTPLWCLRYFMRDIGALPEFEYLVHYYEFVNGKDLCPCGEYIRSEKMFKEEFIPTKEKYLNLIHFTKTTERSATKKCTFDTIKAIAMNIEKSVLRIFPYFLRLALRYFISSILPTSGESTPSIINVKLAKDQGPNTVRFVGIIDASLTNVPIFLTHTFFTTLGLFISPQLAVHPKSFHHKSTFIETLREIPEKVNQITELLANSERASYILNSLIAAKLDSIPKFSLEVHISSIEVRIISLINQDNFKALPMLLFKLTDLSLTKDILASFRYSEGGEYPLSGNELEIDPNHFIMAKIKLSEASIETSTTILAICSSEAIFHFCPYVSHPTSPSLLLDLHLEKIRATLNTNLLALLHIINSIQSYNIQESNKFTPDNRLVEQDFMSEYRSHLHSYELRKYSKILHDLGMAHYDNSINCKHCLIKNIKLGLLVNFSVGTMTDNGSEGIEIELGFEGEELFNVVTKHVMVSVEEKLFSQRINVFCADIFGKNSTGDSFYVYCGYNHSGGQPYFNSRFARFLPLTFERFYGDGDVKAYRVIELTKLICSDILDESRWPTQTTRSDHKKFTLNPSKNSQLAIFGTKRLISNEIINDALKTPIEKSVESRKPQVPNFKSGLTIFNINENELLTEIYIDYVYLKICFTPSSTLAKGLSFLSKLLSLSKAICPKSSKSRFIVKNVNEKLSLKVATVDVEIELGPLIVEVHVKQVEFTILPVSSTPQISELAFNKAKEAEVTLSNCVEAKISSLDISLMKLENSFRLVKVNLHEIRSQQVDVIYSKIKIHDKALIDYIIKKTEKLNIELSYIQVFSEEILIAAVPSDYVRESIILSKNRGYIQVLGEIGEYFISVPPVTINFEVTKIKRLIQELLHITKPKSFSFQGFEEIFIIDTSRLLYLSTKPRLVINLNQTHLRFCYNSNLIFSLKLDHLHITNNLQKVYFEKYMNMIKERPELLYSESYELVLFIKSAELIPADSIYENMIRFSSDYSLFIRINSKFKQIQITCVKPAKVIFINKVLDELLMSIKEIKSIVPKKEKKESEDYTLDCNFTMVKVKIPRNSMSDEFVKAICAHAKINVYTGDKKIKRPTIINENTEVYNNKEVLHDEVEEIGPFPCDLVTILLRGTNLKTYYNNKKKALGSLSELTIDVCSPNANEEFKEFHWKTDSFININFINADIKASMAYFLNLQKIIETNLDEELENFQKPKKWEKVEINLNIGDTEVELEQYEIKTSTIEEKEETKEEENNEGIGTLLQRTRSNFMPFGRTNTELHHSLNSAKSS